MTDLHGNDIFIQYNEYSMWFNKHSLDIYYEVGIFSQEHKAGNENNQFCLNNNWQVNHLHCLNGTDQRELN